MRKILKSLIKSLTFIDKLQVIKRSSKLCVENNQGVTAHIKWVDERHIRLTIVGRKTPDLLFFVGVALDI